MSKESKLELGLSKEEKKILREKLDREPNSLEWAMVDAEWSEHCSYKSSKSILKMLPSEGKRVLLGPGYDAGVVDVGDNYIVTFHIESHNHPSAIDPYGGAATGIGGVVRDILAVGTRPIALLDSLHFGDIKKSANSRWLLKNVVKGISDYGNCIGVPTVGGEIGFDKSFEKNCLVDVICVGLGKKKDLVLAEAKYPGDIIILMGGSTGRDGIHGVTFASKVLSESSESDRSAVQIPNPFMKKLIIEATLEAISKGYVRGLKDLGGGGLTCGLSEMAYKGKRGMNIDFTKIPLRENDMLPVEALISESQERMVFIIEQKHEEDIYKIFSKYEVPFEKIGVVTENNRLIIRKGKKIIADLPVKTVVDAPIIKRKSIKPKYIDVYKNVKASKEPKDLSKILLKLLSSPTISNKKWVYEQYDNEVGIRTIVKPGQSGAAVIRLDNGKYLAVKVDGNPKHCFLDPYNGAAGILAESCRNIVSVGGDPIAMVDHCQFGDPNNPEVFWTFNETIRGMADYCNERDLPCVGGKVSFYNEDLSIGIAIKPSPIVSVIGIIENIDFVKRMNVDINDNVLVMFGITKPELGGSEYYEYIHNITGGFVPKVYFNDENNVQNLVFELIQKKLVNAVNDCSKGGLAIALAEMLFYGNQGIELDLSKVITTCNKIDDILFSESHSRMLVSIRKSNLENIFRLAKKYRVKCSPIGLIRNKGFLVKNNGQEIISLSLEDIIKPWNTTIPENMGEVN
jgi:phosphoribosylformylglycinamidine synthase